MDLMPLLALFYFEWSLISRNIYPRLIVVLFALYAD